MPRALDIANWIIQYRTEEMAAPVDAMSLEKLTYYAHAFRLALYREPLFPEEVRAWTYGPVIREVYDRYPGWRLIEAPTDDVPQLAEETENFLIDVVQIFGGLTAFKLSEATHEEKPWKQARQGYSRRERSDELIPNDVMQAYYACLIEEGESALSRQELLSDLDEPRWGAMYVAGICINQMRSHPLYKPILAKKLREPVERVGDLPSDFYSPIGRPSYDDRPMRSDDECLYPPRNQTQN